MAARIESIETDWQDVSGFGTQHYVMGQTAIYGALTLRSGTDIAFETVLRGEELQLYGELVRRVAERVEREIAGG